MTVYANHVAPAECEIGEPWLGLSEMAGRVRSFDWTQTPLGRIERWPHSLRSTVAICLRSPLPMAVYWGPELNCIYNDAEREVLGDLHPQALGMPAHELLGDSWPVVGPRLRSVLERGESTWGSYFTYAYSPIPADDQTVGGVLVIKPGTTARVLEERARYEGELRAVLNDLRAAQRRVAAAGDAERRRIERDLHDGAQQRLMAMRLELGLLEERLRENPKRALSQLADVRRELDEALEELRELAHGLYPPLLATDGLEAALAATARRSPLPVTIEATAMTRAPRSIESTAYFCCLEALQNAAKHAGRGARVAIELQMANGSLRFRISDDGAGFDAEVVRPGQGLTNLNDRLNALGGTADVSSSPGAGTTVSGEIPVP